MDYFSKNLLALQKTNPMLALKLADIQSNTRFEIFADTNTNVNLLDKVDNTPLYIQAPSKEIQHYLQTFNKKFSLYKILYFYGIGNGYLYKLLLQNRHHKIIYIIEPELELIYIALNLFDFSEDIEKHRLVVVESATFNAQYFFANLNEELEISHFKAYELHTHINFYEQKYATDLVRVNKEFIKVFSHYVQLTGNDIIDELTGIKHFLDNLPIMLENPSLKQLKNKAKIANTVVIVATGPSLAKQLPQLKKIQDYTAIISVDASLPILEREGIKPDIVTSIERVAATAAFYKNTSKDFKKDIVFCISAVAHKDLIENIDNGYLQLNMRPREYFKSFAFHDWGYLGEGMSAANMAYELASQIGFSHIILIGQDLAYNKDGKSHARHHIFGENEIKHNNQKDDYIEAYGGEGTVRTTSVWKLFLNGYIKSIAHNNSEGKILTLNATEGGARIPGTKEVSFSNAIDEYINFKKKKKKISLTKIEQSQYIQHLNSANIKLDEIIADGNLLKKTITKLLKDLTRVINQNKQYSLEDLHKYFTIKESKKLIEKISKIRKQYYGTKFGSFYFMLLSPLISHLEYDIAYWSLQPEDTQKKLIQKRWKMIVYHHQWAYRILINTEAILKILVEKQNILQTELNIHDLVEV